MTTAAKRRLMRDFKKLQQDPPVGVSGAPTEENILKWDGIIFGPPDTPFEDGTFKLSMEFSEDYPNKPPLVKFVSKMFHPNVYTDGSICLDILQNRWSPTYDVSAILTTIQSLLDEPNPNSPANALAAQLYQENRREYDKRVQQIVEQSWLNFDDFEYRTSQNDGKKPPIASVDGSSNNDESPGASGTTGGGVVINARDHGISANDSRNSTHSTDLRNQNRPITGRTQIQTDGNDHQATSNIERRFDNFRLSDDSD